MLTNEQITEKLTLPPGKLRVVIDTDAYNEVDDQFAIAYALCSPERLQIEALYAAPFTEFGTYIRGIADERYPKLGMEQSYDEILHIVSLVGDGKEYKVCKGSENYLKSKLEPVESEAARDLVERAMASDETLYVLAMGAITNIASAILMEPKIIDKIVVVWLAGQPHHYPNAGEFNLSQDLLASQIIFESGVPLVHIPCFSVTSNLITTTYELKQCLGTSKLAKYLTKIVEEGCEASRAVAPGFPHYMRNSIFKQLDDYPEDVLQAYPVGEYAPSRMIWDISVIAFVVNPNWCPSTLVPAPILCQDKSFEQKTKGHPIRVCNFIYRDFVFGDMFGKLNKIIG